MNITLQSVGFTASEHLQHLTLKKAAKLFHLNDRIIRVDVSYRKGATHNPENEWCEIYVSLPGYNQFAKKNSEMFEKSLDTALEAVQNLLRKKKEKRITVRKIEGDKI